MTGEIWKRVSLPDIADLDGLYVKLPVSVEVKRDETGRVRRVGKTPEEGDAAKEAATYVRSLAKNRQISGRAGDEPVNNPTHKIVTDDEGRRKLVRTRFSAL